MKTRFTAFIVILATAASLSGAAFGQGSESPDSTRESPASASDPAPEGVEILMPRGGIPAVFEPEFVPAGSAEITDDAWVLGIVIDGIAKAYSLNLLNRHEIVNDRFGDKPIAAVW